MRTDMPPTIRLKDYRPASHLIPHTQLSVTLSPERTIVKAKLNISPNPQAEDNTELCLDGIGLEMIELLINGEKIPPENYTLTDKSLTLRALPQDNFVLETACAINPQANTALTGLYLSNGNYCSQCEAEGFRHITWFLDRPDALSRFKVRVEGSRDLAPILLANGNAIDNGDGTEPGNHYVVWEDPLPKPSYLFAMVAGDLAMVEDHFVTMSGRKVVLRIFVEHGKQDRCDFAMQALKKSMAWDEETFGREYDLDIFMIVAVSDFNMGAMENKGLNVFNDKYVLARPDTATDQDYSNIEAIIAHEYFHNWSGNRITCRDWFQLCLKEGLTVFRDQEFSSDVRSRPVQRITNVRNLRAQQFPEDGGPLAHPVRPGSYIEINNFYTATIYEKGAEIVRMLRSLIGDAPFKAGMTLYFDRHDGEAVTMEDFIACMAETSGRDLNHFFRWYEQAGTPQIIVEDCFHEDDGIYELTLSQITPSTPGQAKKRPLHIPLMIGLIDDAGNDLTLQLEGGDILERPVIELTQAAQSFRFCGFKAKPALSLNRQFSAPVEIKSGQTLEQLLFLLEHDNDSFNQWDSGQNAAHILIMQAIRKLEAGAEFILPTLYVQALTAAIENFSVDPGFIALLLTPPNEADIAGHIGKDVDPALIHNGRNMVLAQLGRALKKPLEKLWQGLQTPNAYSPDAQSAACRSARKAALNLLCYGYPRAYVAHALAIVMQRTNMTEEIAGLTILSQFDCPERDAALTQFYDRYHDDHLLIDKWFTLQAIAPLPGTIDQVHALMAHQDFSLRRPNRVRALIASFATANPLCFNAADGAGYDLVAKMVVALDAINPQVAARLATCFRSWRMLEPGRRELARQALSRIRSSKDLSTDCFEIVNRSLENV